MAAAAVAANSAPSEPPAGADGAGDGVIEVSAARANLPLVTLNSNGSEATAATASGPTTSTTAATAAGNGKEKTPMCLVNELARHNKIDHLYQLTSEDGPPHRKRFTVTLKLGDETYTAEQASIKKAQHAAAATAIKGTMYKHPPAKVNRSQLAGGGGCGGPGGGGTGNAGECDDANGSHKSIAGYHVSYIS